MTSQELNDWGNRLYQELYSKWREWGSSCPLLIEKGYALFYSEIKMNPELMIIGYNPGWNKDFKPEDPWWKIPKVGFAEWLY